MSEQDIRLTLLNTLLTTPHRNLRATYPIHKEMIEQDPRFYVQVAAWYADHGDVRDHKEMFVINLCLSQFEGHRDVGLALLRELPPYEVARVVDFIKGQEVTRPQPKEQSKPRGKKAARAKAQKASQEKQEKKAPQKEKVGLFVNVPRSMRTEIQRYLRERERDPQRLDSALLHGREAMKRLYAGLHIQPSERSQAILFANQPPEESILYAVKQIAKAESPAEQARAIAQHRIPYRVAASLIREMTPMVLAALIDVMTPQEVINNMGSLKKHGAFENEDVKKLVNSKLEAAKGDKRVSAYKAKVAIEAAGVSGELAEKLDEITETQVKSRGSIKRPTALLVDKCVVGATLVCTEHGLVPIESLAPQVKMGVREVVLDMRVATRSGSAAASRLFLNGTKPVRYIETEKGFRLGASLNHPVLCYQPATATLAWRAVGTLRPGDYVALRRNSRSFGRDVSLSDYKVRIPYQPTENQIQVPDRMSPELARWLGYIAAEGHIRQRPGQVTFTNGDPQLIADFCELTITLFGLTPRVEDIRGCKTIVVISEEMLHFLGTAIGFRKNRARDCEVPLCVLMSSEETQRAFLQAYFAGDGGLMNRRTGMLAATSASERLMRTIQVMLLNFGIVSRLKSTKSLATNGQQIERDYWRLTIGGNDAARFMQEIGFASDTKHAAVQVAVGNSHALEWSSRWDSVPGLGTVLVASQPGTPYALHQAFPSVTAFRSNARVDRVGTALLPAIVASFPQIGKIGDLQEITDSSLFLDAIAEIKEGEEPVYDLCVPGEHSFISNGIVSHNSGSMNVAIEVGRQLGAMISAICESDFFAYAFDSMPYPIKARGQSLADWEKALAGIHAGGSTSCGVALEWMRKQKQRVEQIIMVTDEGENHAPLFKDAYTAYAEALATRPDVIFVKVGQASNTLERACAQIGVSPSAFEFKGDYYALTNLIPLLTRPSMLDLLMEIMVYPLPTRKAG